jgi:DNA polymerase III subunit beta
VRAWLHQATADSDFGAFDHSGSPDPNTEEITIMEIVVRTTDFARVLRLVQTLADRKSTVPVLGTLPDSELALKAQTSGWVSLSFGRSRSRIAVLSAESFPELPKPLREGASFSAGVLARLIEKACVEVSSESANTALAGALLKIDTSMLRIVATDGHRLARDGSRCDSRAGKAGSGPAKDAGGLSAFCRRPQQPGGPLCAITDNHIFFVWQERLLFSPKLSGVFPNYERVLPKSHAASLSLNRNDLRSALERVAQFTESKTRCVAIEVSTNRLCVRAHDTAVRGE